MEPPEQKKRMGVQGKFSSPASTSIQMLPMAELEGLTEVISICNFLEPHSVENIYSLFPAHGPAPGAAPASLRKQGNKGTGEPGNTLVRIEESGHAKQLLCEHVLPSAKR